MAYETALRGVWAKASHSWMFLAHGVCEMHWSDLATDPNGVCLKKMFFHWILKA